MNRKSFIRCRMYMKTCFFPRNSDTLSTISIEEISNNDDDDHQLEQDNNEDDRVVQNVGQIVNTQPSAYYLATRN